MKLTIISSQMTGLFIALTNLGLCQMEGVVFSRSPFKVGGMWRCQVIV